MPGYPCQTQQLILEFGVATVINVQASAPKVDLMHLELTANQPGIQLIYHPGDPEDVSQFVKCNI
jgi:hypothetical protein